MKKKILILLVLICSIFSLIIIDNSEIVVAADDYYSSIDDSDKKDELKQELRDLITTTHTNKTSYDDCKNPEIIRKTDGNKDQSKIVLFWSNIEVDVKWDNGTTWNREHVWPQSQGWFEESGAGSDLHHIRPTDKSVNSSHNNNPYGIVTTNDYCITSEVNGRVQIDAKCKGNIFEPSDSKKGDTARIIFYLLVRYEESDSCPITNVAKSMEMLLEWNKLDPVDDSEIRRNDAVAEIQGNRNPFIDNSEYADLIWSDEVVDDNPEQGDTPSLPNNAAAIFEFGSNSSQYETESSNEMNAYSEVNNGYTLNLTNLTKVYTSYDASGNSCLKIGTSSVAGSFQFKVPEEINKVEIYVTGYKSTTPTIIVNNKSQIISTLSAKSEYTIVTIDTSVNKLVNFSTKTNDRCKINTIVYYSNESNSSIECVLNQFKEGKTFSSLYVNYSYELVEEKNTKDYSYTFTQKQFSQNETKDLNGVNWTLDGEGGYFGYDGTKGQQFGSENNPYKNLSLKTTTTFDDLKEIIIYASGASKTNAVLSVYVNDVKVGETVSLTSTNTKYSFQCDALLDGDIRIEISQTASKAIYIKQIDFVYEEKTTEYTLNNAGIRFGSYISKDLFDLLNNPNTLWGVEYIGSNVTDWNNVNCNYIYCTPALVSEFNATQTDDNGKIYQWSLVVENLGYSHLDKEISARMFVEYNGERYYMSSATFSIRSLANAYLNECPSEYTSYTDILNHIKNY